MVRSMTGFGRGQSAREGLSATVEVRSVNQRFLNVSVRLPAWLQWLEAALREAASARIRRGQVDVTVELSGELASPRPVIDVTAARGYVEGWRRVQKELGVPGEISIGLLAACPDITRMSPPAGSPEEIESAAREALSAALDGLDEARVAEGEFTARGILERLGAIEETARRIEGLAPAAVKASVERLSRRVAELLDSSRGELSHEELAREVAILAEKGDVAEELERLHSHIAQVRAAMADGVEAGRKLDFLVQEMNREINTIGSKAQSVEIGREVVGAKAEVERIREQARNIE